MFITPSFKKSLIVEQFQGNYLKLSQAIVSLFVTIGFILSLACLVR